MNSLKGIKTERIGEFMKPEVGSMGPVGNPLCGCKGISSAMRGRGPWASWRARGVTSRRFWILYRRGANWIYLVGSRSWASSRWGFCTKAIFLRCWSTVRRWLRKRLLGSKRRYGWAVPREGTGGRWEYAQLGTTVSGVKQPDCSAVATSSAQERILAGWGDDCDVNTAVCALEKSGGGCGTWVLPFRSSSCDEIGGHTAVEGELVSLSIYRWSSPELEEEVAGEGSGFARA